MRPHLHLAAGLVALSLVAVLPSAGRAAGFLSVCDDLPLPPGLAEVAGSGLAFDSPTGRIVEAYAEGKGSPEQVLRFYAATLPQLGWTREDDTRFRRDAEVLRLDAQSQGPAVVVHFTVSPE